MADYGSTLPATVLAWIRLNFIDLLLMM